MGFNIATEKNILCVVSKLGIVKELDSSFGWHLLCREEAARIIGLFVISQSKP